MEAFIFNLYRLDPFLNFLQLKMEIIRILCHKPKPTYVVIGHWNLFLFKQTIEICTFLLFFECLWQQGSSI